MSEIPGIQLKYIYLLKCLSLFSSKCLFTQDNFATAVELRVSSSLLMVCITLHISYCISCVTVCHRICLLSHYLQQSEATVKLAVFSGGNLVVLLQSGRVLVFNGTTQTWGDPSGENKTRFFFSSLK